MQPIPLYQKAGAGLAAGGLGALVGSPADLSLIRMQSDSTLPVAQRRNYRGVGDALVRIVKDDGVGGLFRGAGPTVVRAMALNMGMLASNDHVSTFLSSSCLFILPPGFLLDLISFRPNLLPPKVLISDNQVWRCSPLTSFLPVCAISLFPFLAFEIILKSLASNIGMPAFNDQISTSGYSLFGMIASSLSYLLL